MVHSGPFVDAVVCRVKDGSQFSGMSHEHPLQLLVITDPEQHSHRFATACYDNRTGRTGLQV